MTKMFYEPINLKDNDILEVLKVQLVQDAAGDDEAVRKLQAETIAALAVQAKIIANVAQVTSDTFFSSDYTTTALATKQPNMSIDPSSTAYLEIVDGSKIKLKDLGILSTHKHPGCTSLASYISLITFNGNGTITDGGDTLDAMTFIFLEDATLPSERSFIYLGTNNGDASDFVSFNVDYNTQEIRTFFSATGTGLAYDTGTGIFSLSFGNSAGELGAHSIPVNPAEFSVVTGSTILALLKAMETYISNVDAAATGGAATIDTRLSTLSGVAGNSMGTFNGSILTDNLAIKPLIQEIETALAAGTVDRAAIRSEFASADSVLSAAITTEASVRNSADITLTQALATETATRTSMGLVLNSGLSSEANTRELADTALDARLATVEGSAVTVGSIAKAQADAIAAGESYTDAEVLIEKSRAVLAEAVINTKVDNLAVGDIKYIGNIDASSVISMRAAQIAVESPSSRNGLDFQDVYAVAGEVFVAVVDQTITFDDSSTLVVQNGDRLMCVEDATAGSLTASDWNVVQSDASAITVANINGDRIEQDLNGFLDITADAVTRTHLAADVEADIDDRQSLTTSNTITSPTDTHFYTSTDFGAQQNVYWKRTQAGSNALTGTVRTSLAELFINSNGSGNPYAPSYAHTTTHSATYQGSSTDLSLVLAGANFEANAKAGTAIHATGLYARADQDQLGYNIGATMVADNGSTSNVGAFAFSGTEGTGKDRGIVAAVADYDILVYSGLRAADPFPYNDICVVADAKYAPAGTKALYAHGDVKLDSGKVEITEAPTTETGAIRLADIKAVEKCYEMDLTDGVTKTFSCPLDLNKCIIQTTHNNDSAEVRITRDAIANEITVTAFGDSLTDVRILVQQLSCDVTSV